MKNNTTTGCICKKLKMDTYSIVGLNRMCYKVFVFKRHGQTVGQDTDIT